MESYNIPHLISDRLAASTQQCRVYRSLCTEFLEPFGIYWNKEFPEVVDGECSYQQNDHQLLVLPASASSPSATCFLQDDDLLRLKHRYVIKIPNTVKSMSLKFIKYIVEKKWTQLVQPVIRHTDGPIIERKSEQPEHLRCILGSLGVPVYQWRGEGTALPERQISLYSHSIIYLSSAG